MNAKPPVVVNIDDVDDIESSTSARWGQSYRPLTPALDARPGSLGANLTRVKPGMAACPFHYHMREDEIFYVISGTGVLRYGEELFPLRPGDCVSCPAGTRTAHQIANTGDEDLVYLAVGPNDPDEVCVYPDTGKIMVRALKECGRLEVRPYMDGEPEVPKVFDLVSARRTSPR